MHYNMIFVQIREASALLLVRCSMIRHFFLRSDRVSLGSASSDESSLGQSSHQNQKLDV